MPLQVTSLGGVEQVHKIDLGPIPLPDVNSPPSLARLIQQAFWQEQRRKAAWAGQPWFPGMPAGRGEEGGDGR